MSLTVMHSAPGIEARDSPLNYAESMQEVAPPNNGLVLTARSPSLRSGQRPAAQAVAVSRAGQKPSATHCNRSRFVTGTTEPTFTQADAYQ